MGGPSCDHAMQRSDRGRVSWLSNALGSACAAASAAAPRRGLRRERREPAVPRIGDQRGPPTRQPLGDRRPQPDLVVVVDVMALVPRAVALELVALELLAVVDVDQGEDLARGRIDALGSERLLQPGPLLLGERFPVGQVLGPLERGERLGRPVALEIGRAVGHAGQRLLRRPVRAAPDRGLRAGGDRRQQPERDDRDRHGKSGVAHLVPPGVRG